MSKRTQYGVQLSAEELSKKYDKTQFVFATFTVPQTVKGKPIDAFNDPRSAQKLWNSFNTNILKNYAVNGVVCIEPRPADKKNPGSVHWHALLVMPYNVANNMDWLKAQFRAKLPKYGLGHIFHLEIPESQVAITRYIAKYIGKADDMMKYKPAVKKVWKGIRRSRFLGKSTKVRNLVTPAGLVKFEPEAYNFFETVAVEETYKDYKHKFYCEENRKMMPTIVEKRKHNETYENWQYRRIIGWRNNSCKMSWIAQGWLWRRFREFVGYDNHTWECWLGKKWGYYALKDCEPQPKIRDKLVIDLWCANRVFDLLRLNNRRDPVLWEKVNNLLETKSIKIAVG